jgi:hypothetical protein
MHSIPREARTDDLLHCQADEFRDMGAGFTPNS